MRRKLVFSLLVISVPLVFYCRQWLDLDSFGAIEGPLFHDDMNEESAIANLNTTQNTPSNASIPLQPMEPVDYTDPLDITRNVFYGYSFFVLTDSRTMARRYPTECNCQRRLQVNILLHIPRSIPVSSLFPGDVPRSLPSNHPP
jgi:hypothetical protein